MSRLSSFIVAVLVVAASPNLCRAAAPGTQLTEAERRGGWQLLFDGKTTKGWRNYQQPKTGAGWTVGNGELRRSAEGAGDLITAEQYDYFELSLEYKISKGGNSGIMFHVTEQGKRPWHTGPEIQIQDNADGHDRQLAGWLYQLYKPVKPKWAQRFEKQVGFSSPEVADATRPAGQWNHVYLRVSAQQCEVAVNGVSYYYFRIGDDDWNRRVKESKFKRFAGFGKAGKGHICLQDHGDEVAFRNIKLRKLPADGSVPDPIDGYLPLKLVEAFPNLKWEGWQGVSDDGKIKAQRPLILTHAGDGSGRVFVGSQIGMIHVLPDSGPSTKQAKLFLDLRGKTHDWAQENEEGFLGLAFHPRYRDNGQLFVCYSPEAEPRMLYVSRFTVSKHDPDRADPASEQVVMRIKQPFANHNGGSIAFGPDGYLYIALGDGGGRNDPVQHGQNLATWMGSILRIDVDRRVGGKQYAIPTDNPFVDRKNARPEIYAYGFRNVWRLSFDRQTGKLWCGDVGQDLWEEVNVVRPGGNYGWSLREGSYGFNNGDRRGGDPEIGPVWEYDHRVGKSITGGFVYRGKQLPELAGHYLYADYISGKLWALKIDDKTGKVVRNMGIRTSGVPVFSFGEDELGEVYILVSAPTGRTVFRLQSGKD